MKSRESINYKQDWQVVLKELSAFPNSLGDLVINTGIVSDMDNLTEVVRNLKHLSPMELLSLIERKLQSETLKKRKEMISSMQLEGYFDLNLIRNSKTLGANFIKEKTPIASIAKQEEIGKSTSELQNILTVDKIKKEYKVLTPRITDIESNKLFSKVSHMLILSQSGIASLGISLDNLHRQYEEGQRLASKVKNGLNLGKIEIKTPHLPDLSTLPKPLIYDKTKPLDLDFTVNKLSKVNIDTEFKSKIDWETIYTERVKAEREDEKMISNAYLKDAMKDKDSLDNYYLTYLKGKRQNKAHFNFRPGYFDDQKDKYIQYDQEDKTTLNFLKFTTWLEMPVILLHESPYIADKDYYRVAHYLKEYLPMQLQGPLGEIYSVSRSNGSAGILISYLDHIEDKRISDVVTRTGLSQVINHKTVTKSTFARNKHGTPLMWNLSQGGWVSAVLYIMKLSFIPLFDSIVDVPKVETLIDQNGHIR